MLRKVIRPYIKKLAWEVLIIIALITCLAIVVFNLKIGIMAGLIAFLLLNGIGVVWELLTN